LVLLLLEKEMKFWMLLGWGREGLLQLSFGGLLRPHCTGGRYWLQKGPCCCSFPLRDQWRNLKLLRVVKVLQLLLLLQQELLSLQLSLLLV
jgi:hypothetical protein